MNPHPDATRDVDVLVIGGGLAGTWAALRAAERSARVLLVDKATVSRSGYSVMSGGITIAPQAGDDLDEWTGELVRAGGYVADQDWARILLEDQQDRLRHLAEWGVPMMRGESGEIKRIKTPGMNSVRCIQFSARQAMEILRSKVVAAGVEILDKVSILDLVTSDGELPTSGRVCGAVGVGGPGSRFYGITAKRTILATGPVAIKGYLPPNNASGDGLAFGYRVGGCFQDMEFASGGAFSFVWGRYFLGSFSVGAAAGHGARLLNARGERFMERYDPVLLERGDPGRVLAAFAKEVKDGRGPIALDLTSIDDGYWDALRTVRGGRQSVLLSDAIPDARQFPVLIEPSWSFRNTSTGGMFVDLHGRTTIPGLFAVGNVARNGAIGYHGSAGTPTAYAMVSGGRAGAAAADEASLETMPTISDTEFERLRTRALGPLSRSASAPVDDYYRELTDIMGSSIDLLIQSSERIDDSLRRLSDLRSRLEHVGVDSQHELVKFHDMRNTLDVMELIYSSMGNRTESRQNFFREDYPFQDDVHWLCWHLAWRTAQGVAFEQREIPFDRFPHAPERRDIKPSWFAEIYDPSVDADEIYEGVS